MNRIARSSQNKMVKNTGQNLTKLIKRNYLKSHRLAIQGLNLQKSEVQSMLVAAMD